MISPPTLQWSTLCECVCAGADSYRQHGLRLLLIWLHCQLLSAADCSQLMYQLSDALVAINRPSLAGHSLTHSLLCIDNRTVGGQSYYT